MDPLWSAPISAWDAPVEPPTASAALTSLEAGAVVFLPTLAFRPLAEEARLFTPAILGTAKNKGSVISFVMENPPISSLDIGTRLDGEGVAVRTGHHCCMPLMARLNVPSTTRASFAVYNTHEEVERLVDAVAPVLELLR